MSDKKTVLLGASDNPSRYSFLAANRLITAGHEVILIGKKAGSIQDNKIVTGTPKVSEVHTVSIYLNLQNQKQYYNYILSLKPQRVIFNPGAENPELENLLTENRILFEHACTLVLLSTGAF